MLSKILTIAWNGIYRVYTDRTALLFMFLIPVALSTIIGLAFGTGSGDILPTASKVIVINQDQGTEIQGNTVIQGQTYVNVLVENVPPDLEALIAGETGADIEAARQQVEEGEVTAVLVIPPDFSEKMADPDQQGSVYLYYNPGSEIKATIVLNVVEGITAVLNSGQVGQTLLFDPTSGYIIQQAVEAEAYDAIGASVENAIPRLYNQRVDDLIQLQPVNVEGEVQEFDSLRYFAPSMAILFMTFAMAGGTRSILEEQQNWTLQRIMTTPTPRWVYMAGRLLGTFTSGLIQMTILLLVTPLLAGILGRATNIWGDNLIGLALLTFAVVAAATGLGLFIAAISKSVSQADTYSNAIILVLAMFGGTFLPTVGIPVLDVVGNLSLNKWGILGYNDLANNDAPLAEIMPNIAMLLLMAAIYFVVALWQFNRRLNV